MQEDMIVMKDGRVMKSQNGRLTPMSDEITMPDGTRILMDGTVILIDGTTRMMAEGETMYTTGRVADTPAIPDMGATEEMTGTETHDPS